MSLKGSSPERHFSQCNRPTQVVFSVRLSLPKCTPKKTQRLTFGLALGLQILVIGKTGEAKLLVDLRRPLIFVKPRKCASTSVEIALDWLIWGDDESPSNYEELRFFSRRPDGFVTHLRENSMKWRYVSEDKDRGFRNSLDLSSYRWLTTLRVAHDLRNASIPHPLVSSLQVVGKFQPHTSVTTIKKVLGEEFWTKSLKVTITRNPWDSVVSDYFWSTRNSKAGTVDFGGFVKRHSPSLVNREISEFAAEFDYIIRYENLAGDFHALALQLGFTDFDIELPSYKSRTRPKEPKHYSEFYDTDTASRVADLYREYIQQFDYVY
jgi:hypothetical protein